MMGKVTYTIFGGTGDLSFRKLIPAFFNIHASGELDFNIVVIGRRDYTTNDYCQLAYEWVVKHARYKVDEVNWQTFCQIIHYIQMDLDNAMNYQKLMDYYKVNNMNNHIYYFAVAPSYFGIISNHLVSVNATNQAKVVVEKPFGNDLEDAKRLYQQLIYHFGEDNVYYIDHYLGKEMVRNIMTIRFANPMFASVWNREYIDYVEINALETLGVETRGNYYDHVGALNDMVANHLFQILSIVAMEPLAQLTSEQLKVNQLNVLTQLKPVDTNDVNQSIVLGQYAGYRNEMHVNTNSLTETYAAVKLYIDNPRWMGVPFIIQTGKKLDRKQMEVIIHFKPVPGYGKANILVIKIAPNEGVYYQFNIKQPGNSDAIIQTSMDFCQSCQDVFRINTPAAYERLLLALANSDHAMFSDWRLIETSWIYMNQLKQAIAHNAQNLRIYPQGSNASFLNQSLFSE